MPVGQVVSTIARGVAQRYGPYIGGTVGGLVSSLSEDFQYFFNDPKGPAGPGNLGKKGGRTTAKLFGSSAYVPGNALSSKNAIRTRKKARKFSKTRRRWKRKSCCCHEYSRG